MTKRKVEIVMRNLEPDLKTKLIFNGSVIVDVSADYKDSVFIEVYDKEDEDNDLKFKSFFLEPDEVDLFISILTLYKNRILNGRKDRHEDD